MGLQPHVAVFKSGQVEPAWLTTPLLISSSVRSNDGRITIPLSNEKVVETATKETQTEDQEEESTLPSLPVVE